MGHESRRRVSWLVAVATAVLLAGAFLMRAHMYQWILAPSTEEILGFELEGVQRRFSLYEDFLGGDEDYYLVADITESAFATVVKRLRARKVGPIDGYDGDIFDGPTSWKMNGWWDASPLANESTYVREIQEGDASYLFKHENGTLYLKKRVY